MSQLEPPRSARAAAEVWRRLATPCAAAPFRPELADGLPEPARRWVVHSVAPGTPLHAGAVFEMHGSIRLGRWRRFRARQVLVPGVGYLWAATARVNGLPVLGYDRFSGGTAEMRWRLCGLLPVVVADGDDVARSAAGRLAAEGVLVPTAFAGARWDDGPGAGAATATWPSQESVELHVGPAGELRSVRMQRWGDPCGEPFGRHPFGVELADEVGFDGVTVPTSLRAGWFWGTPRQEEGEFFRARVTSVTWR